MKLFITFFAALFLFAGCAGRPTQPELRPVVVADDPSAPKRSAERAELTGQVAALTYRVRAIDDQIANQRLAIDGWEAGENPSAPSLIAGARRRIRALEEEKARLAKAQTGQLEAIRKLNEEEER